MKRHLLSNNRHIFHINNISTFNHRHSHHHHLFSSSSFVFCTEIFKYNSIYFILFGYLFISILSTISFFFFLNFKVSWMTFNRKQKNKRLDKKKTGNENRLHSIIYLEKSSLGFRPFGSDWTQTNVFHVCCCCCCVCCSYLSFDI